MGVLGRGSEGELVQVRLPDHAPAGGLQRDDRGCGLRRNVVGEERRAVRRREPCGVEEVLDCERPTRRLSVRER
jgi:hypothetical protein